MIGQPQRHAGQVIPYTGADHQHQIPRADQLLLQGIIHRAMGSQAEPVYPYLSMMARARVGDSPNASQTSWIVWRLICVKIA